MGSLLYALYRIFFHLAGKKFWLSNFLVSVIFGICLFFNNLNIDLYFKATENQRKFWQIFIKRFPALPERAVFLMDVEDKTPIYSLNLDTSYDFEFILNFLYAKSKEKNQLSQYRALTLEEYNTARMNRDNLALKETFSKIQAQDPERLITVYYRDDKLLVNREIIKQDASVVYRLFADKDFPRLPKPVFYPLRRKIPWL